MLPAIVTDIEGTTSRIDFVHQVLFPYARARISEFLHEHQQDPKVAAEIAAVRRTIAAPAVSLATVIQQLIDWIDQDRKVTELKALQGMIWQHGFESSQFSAHVYPDAVECLGRWHQAGHSIHVYSSGSIAAQKLFFRYSVFGDLSALFSGYFDTTIGGKREPGSYLRIAEAIDQAPGAILFLSDLEAELDAAAYVVGSQDEHLAYGAGFRVYVRNLGAPDTAKFSIYRRGGLYRDPDTNTILGYEAEHVADALVEKFGDPATVQIVNSSKEVMNGDRLLPQTEEAREQALHPRLYSIAASFLFFLCGSVSDDWRSQDLELMLEDEFDRYPDDVDGQGDPLDLGLVRQRTYPHTRLTVGASTPTTSVNCASVLNLLARIAKSPISVDPL